MDGFLYQVNSALARQEQFEMLHEVMGKIEGYVGVEIPPEYEKVCTCMYMYEAITNTLIPCSVSTQKHEQTNPTLISTQCFP